MASCEGTASPTVALKPSGAFWFDACLLTSFQIEVCCASDNVSVSLAAVLVWCAADAAVTPDSANVNARAAEMDFVIVSSFKVVSPPPLDLEPGRLRDVS